MDKEELLGVLQDWNFWKRDLDTGTERKEYAGKCLRFLDTDVITAIIGLRRSGKSYIMRQTIKKLIESGTERKNILMVNFEDKRFAEFYPQLLDEIYNLYMEFLKPSGKPFVFLDEVHNVPKWERWARTMHELGKAKIIVSGSSSKLLGGELATVLTGRHLDVFVFPLDFREFLLFRNLEIRDKLDVISKRIEIKQMFSEYFEFGGFPEVLRSSEKRQLLLTYFDDILTKDIEKRYKLRKTETLRALARFYMTNISNAITFNSLRKKFSTTTNTVEKFSSYMEEANMLFFIKRFSFKVREQENAPRKVYSADVGLANAVGFRFSPDSGRIAENIAAIRLRKEKTSDHNKEIYYWQDVQKREVDFVVKEGFQVRKLIQVCWNINEYRTKEREIKALLKASRELRCKDLLVITEDYEKEEKIEGKVVKYLPLWKWFLS